MVDLKDSLTDKAICGETLTDTLVIDAHAHLGFWKTGTLDCSPERMVRIMDRVGVDAAIVSAFAAIGPDHRLGNDYVLEAARKHPGRLFGYAAINPNYPSDIFSELERCFSSPEFTGIKLHPAFHNYPLLGDGYKIVYEFANSRRLIILSHSWGNAQTLDEVSSRYPDAVFISAHGGGYDPRSNDPHTERFLSIARERDNVYMDVTFSMVYAGGFEQLVEKVGARKLLYASDFPFLSLPFQVGRVLTASLSTEVKRRILGVNAVGLFGLRGNDLAL